MKTAEVGASRHRLRPVPARDVGAGQAARARRRHRQLSRARRSSIASCTSPTPDFNTAVTRFLAGDADFFEQLRPEHLAQLAKDTARRAHPLSVARLRVPRAQQRRSEAAGSAASDLRRPRRASRADDGRRPPRDAEQRVRPVRRSALRPVPARADGRRHHAAAASLRHGAGAGAARLGRMAARTRRRARRRTAADSSSGSRRPRRARHGSSTRCCCRRRSSASARRRASTTSTSRASWRRTATAASTRSSSSSARIRARRASSRAGARSGTRQGRSELRVATATRAVDALLDSATATFDPARTRAYARRAFEMIIEDAPGIWLYEPPSVAGVHKRIRTTRDARRRLLVGDGRLVDPGRRAHRAGSHRAPAHAVGRATLRRRPAAAGDDRRAPRHDGHLRARPPRARRPDRHAATTVAGVTEAVRQQWRASLGLDRPLGEQYVRWVANTLRGDLGYSISLPAAGRRRDRRRAAANAAARRARADAVASRSGSSSPSCSRSGRAARATDGSAACSLVLYSRARLLARAGRADRSSRIWLPILPPAASSIPCCTTTCLRASALLDRLQASRAPGRHAHAAGHGGDRALTSAARCSRCCRATRCARRSRRAESAPRRAAPRAAQRAAAVDHAGRPLSARRSSRRRGADREGVQLAGHGAPRRRRDRVPRLSAHHRDACS